MRDAGRIPKIMYLLTEIWMKQPDTRFNQLVNNLQWEYSRKNDNKGRETVYRKETHRTYTIYDEAYFIDLFHLEDGEFIRFLEDKLKEEEDRNG